MALVQNLGVVRHGRRSGSAKLESGALVIDASEFDRIKYSLSKAQIEEDQRNRRQQEVQESFNKSKSIQSTWTNTIAGQRQNRLNAKAKREAEEEAARVELDFQEEMYQSNERKKIIVRAKKLAFEQSDRTKEFHAALGFVEVLKERELQVENKKIQDGKYAKLEKKYEQRMIKENEAAKELEQHRNLVRLQNNHKNMKGLKIQMETKEQIAERENLEWIEEGKRLAELADAEKYEKARVIEIEIEKKAEMAFLLDHQERANKALELEINAAQEHENKRQKIYISAKEKMMEMRKNKTDELFRSQQEARGRMATKLAQEYKEAEDNIEERIEKARLEKEAAEDKRERLKTEKSKKELEAISKHLGIQLEVKGLAMKQRKEMAVKDLCERKEADSIFKRKEVEKFERKRIENEKQAKHHIFTINQLAAEERRRNEVELHLENLQFEQLREEEDEFQIYAKEIIDTAAKADRNIFPLKAVAAKGAGGGHGPLNSKTGVRPSYLAADNYGAQMPTFKNEITDEMKANLEPGTPRTGKKRLGFTWE